MLLPENWAFINTERDGWDLRDILLHYNCQCHQTKWCCIKLANSFNSWFSFISFIFIHELNVHHTRSLRLGVGEGNLRISKHVLTHSLDGSTAFWHITSLCSREQRVHKRNVYLLHQRRQVTKAKHWEVTALLESALELEFKIRQYNENICAYILETKHGERVNVIRI